MPVSAYPSRSAVRRLREVVLPPDYKDITVEHIYEDKGASYNTTGDSAPQRWQIDYLLLTNSASLAATLDAHFNSAKLTEPFNFVDRYGVTWTNVRYLEYDAPPQDNIGVQVRHVTLIKRPA